MPLYEATVPVRYSQLLLDYIHASQPQWSEAALEESGIAPTLLDDANAALTIGQYDLLWNAIRRHSGRADLGFEVGWRVNANTHGVMTQAILGSTSADEALRVASRYSWLFTPSFSLHYRRQPERGELTLRPVAGMSVETLHGFYEVHVISLYLIMRQLLGERLTSYDVYLPVVAPASYAARYRELKPARIHFEPAHLPEVRTVIDAALLDMPLLPSADSSYALLSAAGRPGKARRWSDWVQLMLREAEDCQPTQVQLADLVNISAHTLARHLASEGNSFRALALDVRLQRACRMLEENLHSVSQIAYRLGYSDIANFSHAFRHVHGVSPSAYRELRAKGI